jgi:hypothetical protein
MRYFILRHVLAECGDLLALRNGTQIGNSRNGLVNIAEQVGGIGRRMYPMTGITVMVFETLAALALGFVIGRIWQIRHDEVERRSSFTLPTVARIPRPKGTETSGQASTSTADCNGNRLDKNGTADLFGQPPRRDLAKNSASASSG